MSFAEFFKYFTTLNRVVLLVNIEKHKLFSTRVDAPNIGPGMEQEKK